MNQKQKATTPKCPYCGKFLKWPDDIESANDTVVEAWFECVDCGSVDYYDLNVDHDEMDTRYNFIEVEGDLETYEQNNGTY